MKIKRFFATDMREAISTVRTELGRDAVILSNRRVRGGIEVVSAIDFDEAMIQTMAEHEERRTGTAASAPRAASSGDQSPAQAPVEPAEPAPAPPSSAGPDARLASAVQDEAVMAVRRELESMRGVLQRELSSFTRNEYARRAPVRARTIQRLIRIGIGESLAGAVARETRDVEVDETAWREALAHLGNHVRIADLNPLHTSGVLALTGPTGVGKTTTAAKLASAAAQRHGRDAVALVALEDETRAVQSPLLSIGQRLGIATCVASSTKALRDTLGSLVGRQLVVIDTPGTSPRASADAWHLEALKGISRLRALVVVAANTHYTDLRTALRAFTNRTTAGCVLTRLDEAIVFGSALSAVIEESIPIALTADGQQTEGGLHRPSACRLVSLAVRAARSSRSPEQTEPASRGRESHDVR